MECSADASNGRGQWLQYVTIGWNVLECSVAFVAALLAGSIALLGFAFDSAIEVISSLAALRRLRSEHDGKAKRHVERKAHKIIGLSFLVFAAYVSYEAIAALHGHRTMAESWIGIILAIGSLALLPWLTAAKRRVAECLGSAALQAETRQTQIALYLSGTLLIGLVLNATLGWWWADPVAALFMVPVMLQEASRALLPARSFVQIR